jgi:hypothetical protein
MTSPYYEALNRIALAEQMLVVGATAGASQALDEAVKQARVVDGPKSKHLNTLIALGRDDVAAALPRTDDDYQRLSRDIADGDWPVWAT